MAPLPARGLKFRDKVGVAFGSYGWSGEWVKLLEAALPKANIRVTQAGIPDKYGATKDGLAGYAAFGRSFGERLRGDS